MTLKTVFNPLSFLISDKIVLERIKGCVNKTTWLDKLISSPTINNQKSRELMALARLIPVSKRELEKFGTYCTKQVCLFHRFSHSAPGSRCSMSPSAHSPALYWQWDLAIDRNVCQEIAERYSAHGISFVTSQLTESFEPLPLDTGYIAQDTQLLECCFSEGCSWWCCLPERRKFGLR